MATYKECIRYKIGDKIKIKMLEDYDVLRRGKIYEKVIENVDKRDEEITLRFDDMGYIANSRYKIIDKSVFDELKKKWGYKE